MYKTVLIAFLVCFFAYLPFSRIPDYFDSVYTTGKVVNGFDSVSQSTKPLVAFEYSRKKYQFDPSYLGANYTVGESVKVIYEEARPEKAAVYRLWGYWVRWKEILACVVIYFLLLQLSIAITNNPSPEAEKELEEYYANPKKKTKYNGNTF